ncbi:protein phosphatase 2C domain-containing protein [Umezawaea sp. Da 62-37]|uniref:protein phosphatase 2C domain-containing protein n=1 Tax=Umezawaea sp. Da 62-37 TaxID=3075927 RepID=UPI0028F70B60|nr:protein phosphatase 2C domain-containing protein [Umezawaea sp. Da 62-37]WNV87632.1 protein phosphatase 2C domain-containing protein [Umezawaea sp. Da 62-37]
MSAFKRDTGRGPAHATVVPWQAAHYSALGESHRRNGLVCQDYSDSRVFADSEWAYAVVADGHGSERYFRSDVGAYLAVQTTVEIFTDFRARALALGKAATTEDLTALWDAESGSLVRTWRSKVHADLVSDPPRIPGKNEGEQALARYIDEYTARVGHAHTEMFFWQLRRFQDYALHTPSFEPEVLGPLPLPGDPGWDTELLGSWQAKAYGTTLLGVLVGPHTLHWVQLGDGAMVKVVNGVADYLVAPPEEAIANVTPSLCDDAADSTIRIGTVPLAGTAAPSALVLATDGVPNSYDQGSGFLKFCEDVVRSARMTSEVNEDLRRWLPEISRQGSGDDMSVALTWTTRDVVRDLDRAVPPLDPAPPPRLDSPHFTEPSADPVPEDRPGGPMKETSVGPSVTWIDPDPQGPLEQPDPIGPVDRVDGTTDEPKGEQA